MTPQQQSKLIEYFKSNFDGIRPTEREMKGIEKIFEEITISEDECYFTPSFENTSATICICCGKEKVLHTIGIGIRANKI